MRTFSGSGLRREKRFGFPSIPGMVRNARSGRKNFNKRVLSFRPYVGAYIYIFMIARILNRGPKKCQPSENESICTLYKSLDYFMEYI